LKDKYLFIQFMILRKECDIPFMIENSDLFMKFLRWGKRGVTRSRMDISASARSYPLQDVMDIKDVFFMHG
jgi:hypothetical protein